MQARNGSLHLDEWFAPRLARTGTALARSSSMSSAAIRVPERVGAQLALVFPSSAPHLFVHEGARQALERRLTAASPGRIAILSITDNRQSIVSHTRKHRVLYVRLHHMFLDSPPRVMDALVRYIVNDDREASLLVGQYIEANGARLARRRPRTIPLVARGNHHDLLAIFGDLNRRYFHGACHALVTWGRKVARKRGQPRRTIRLGSYANLEHLIRIHPVLDHAWVPRYFVAYVVYHEMLHNMLPSARGSAARAANLAVARGETARRVLHPPEFLERERHFRRYERALEWERRHIARLLRSS